MKVMRQGSEFRGYAESLLLAVEKLDYDKCVEANTQIKTHDLPPTQWP